jgi:hypothetical protein
MTALASAKWSAETISWNLGEQTSYLELGTPDFTTEQMEELEKLSNEAIRASYHVTPSWHSVADVNEGKVQGLRKSSKSLPESVLGPVRVVTIAQVDTNTCCRTPHSYFFIFIFNLFLIFFLLSTWTRTHAAGHSCTESCSFLFILKWTRTRAAGNTCRASFFFSPRWTRTRAVGHTCRAPRTCRPSSSSALKRERLPARSTLATH